jgi:hypothetical protein
MHGTENTRYRYIEAKRIAGALGAEISGVNLAAPINQCSQHFAIIDYPPETRVTIRGDRPF